MQQLYQDGMAIVRKLGKADLFVTFTCNPKWPEIQDNLLQGQTANDRPDLVARVFQLRLKRLIAQLVKDGVFGEVEGYLVTVEWQKRGLPHAHILIILKRRFRLLCTDDFDTIVSAELPSPASPLHEIVLNHMIHGPCGVHNPTAPCMKKGKCDRDYPKAFCNATTEDKQGFPLYRRRAPGEGGFKATKKVLGKDVTVDSSWVVPYSPNLLLDHNSHMNVEVAAVIENVKYLHKYLVKMPDRAEVTLQLADGEDFDETKVYLDGRYIATSEAVWRALAFKVHYQSPPVKRLAVHLEGEQNVLFDEHGEVEDIVARLKPTTLMAWFTANAKEDAQGHHLLYQDFVQEYHFVNNQWKQPMLT